MSTESVISATAREVLEGALALPAHERATVVDGILASLHQPDARIDELWLRESRSRLAAYDAGEIDAIPADEVLREFEQA